MIAAVVFDFDGVVLDSETAVFESHRRMYERCGAVLRVDDWCDQVGLWVEGQEERWSARLRSMSAMAPDWPTYQADQRRLFEGLLAREPMQGIRELLDALDQAEVPVAIASTSPASWVIPAAERIGLRDRFPVIVTGDQVLRRKPAPDVYLEATRRLGVDPLRSVALEDSAPGILAACTAGLKTIAIRHALTERHDLTAADLCVAHAGELTLARLANLWHAAR
jgi:HAD superfamily hydrolase (TIGR01509 family)